MTRFHKIKGVQVQFTAEEEAQRDAAEQALRDAAPARALAQLRNRRTQLLAETDFYALSDVTMSEDMETYRQALRDLPAGLSTVEDVENVTYPTKPGD